MMRTLLSSKTLAAAALIASGTEVVPPRGNRGTAPSSLLASSPAAIPQVSTVSVRRLVSTTRVAQDTATTVPKQEQRIYSGEPFAVDKPFHAGGPRHYSRYNTLYQWFAERVTAAASAEGPPRVAFHNADTGTEITYKDMLARVENVASVLYHIHHVRPTDTVLILSPARPHYTVAFFGTLRIGATVTTGNPGSTPEEIARQIQLSGATTVLAAVDCQQVAREAADLVSHARTGVSIGLSTRKPGSSVPDLPDPAYRPAEELKPHCEIILADDHLGSLAPVDSPALPSQEELARTYPTRFRPGSTAILPFSSGTTGFPKGVRLNNQGILFNISQNTELMNPTPSDTFVAFLPFYHIYGLVIHLLVNVGAGSKTVSMSKFDMTHYCTLIQQHKATYLFIAPPVAIGFVKFGAQLSKAFDLSSPHYILSGAAPLSSAAQQECQRYFPNGIVCQGYGMTETGVTISATYHNTVADDKTYERWNAANPNDQVHGKHFPYVGILIPELQARIVDVDSLPGDSSVRIEVDGSEQDANVHRKGDSSLSDPDAVSETEPGEIWVRAPNIMQGYLTDNDSELVFAYDSPEQRRLATRKPENSTGAMGKYHENGQSAWFRTGDIGKIVRRKYLLHDPADRQKLYTKELNALIITDRLKELIKVRGFQVAPAELEATILTLPFVRDVVVIGYKPSELAEEIEKHTGKRPDGEYSNDEVPAAAIVVDPSQLGSLAPTDAPAAVMSHVAQHLSKYKHLNNVIEVDAVPRVPSGKVLRKPGKKLVVETLAKRAAAEQK